MVAKATSAMPSLFLAHGSPMNALGGNALSAALSHLGQSIPRPTSILVISAHWRTVGPQVLRVAQPKTIYDFSGFSPELYQMTYPAPGAMALADRVVELLAAHQGMPTESWGFDHGTWSVLRHLFPHADIPMTQLGITKRATLADHWELAQCLSPLSAEGVLVIGSGNVTHNLGSVEWGDNPKVQAWATQFDQMIRDAILAHDLDVLLRKIPEQQAMWAQAHPTLEHYIPLLYAMGAADSSGHITFPYESMDMGTLSMRCAMFQPA